MQRLATVALVVRDYDEAERWFTGMLGFRTVEDVALSPGRRWLVVAPAGGNGAALLLARAGSPDEMRAVGRQSGGRVFLFLETDDFARDHAAMSSRGVAFEEAPRREPYGTVAVFRDLYGNRWDLIERAPPQAGGAA